MTSSEKWICEGTPKNGKNYSPHGWEHDPHENYSADCEICGLPRESQEPKISGGFPLPKAILIAALAISTLAGGGAAYTFIANCETGLEKIDGQCIDPFLQPYKEAIEQGDKAISIAANYQSIEDLEKARSIITNSLSQLSQIPSEALVYPEVEIKLGEYKAEKAEIDSNSEKEKAALANLKEAETIAQKAKLETDGDRSTSQLTAAKQKWENAKNKLKEIDSSALIVSQAEKYRSDYDQQIKNIDGRIAAMARKNRPAPVRTTYKPPVRNSRVAKPKSYSRPKPKTYPKKSIPSDSCAVNKSPNCLF